MNSINHVILCGNNLPGISRNILTSVFKVPKKTIDNIVSLINNGHHTKWSFVEHAKIKFFTSIPLVTRVRYNIPVLYDDVVKRIRNSEVEKFQNDSNEAILLSELKCYCDENWPRLINNYPEGFLKIYERQRLAYTEAALLFVIAKEKLGIDLNDLYKLIVKVSDCNNFTDDNKNNDFKLHYNPGSEFRYFKRKLNNGIKYGFPSILIHKNKGRESEKKLPLKTTELALALIASTKGFKLSTITDELKSSGYKISYRSVRRINFQNEQLAEIGSKGMSYANINLLPYVIGEKPQYPGDYAEADGTKVPILCKMPDGSISFYKSYTIIDGFSGLPTGCVGPSENETLVMTAWKLFVKEHKFLPREIRHDGGPGHKGEKFIEFQKVSSHLGVVWRPSHQSTELAYVERYHHSLDTTVHNAKCFYVGEGITSKSKRNRPSVEVMRAYRNDPNLPTTEKLRSLYFEYQKEFRNKIISQTDKGLLSGKSPNNKWHSVAPKNAVQINATQYVQLFGNKELIKVKKGVIRFKPIGKDGRGDDHPVYKFTIYQSDIFEKYNKKYIIVRYDFDDMSKAYLFNQQEEFIATVDPSPVVKKTKFGQTPTDKHNLRIHKEKKQKLITDLKDRLKVLKEVESQYEERKIPIEVLTHYDEKDSADSAHRDYFLELTRKAEKETLKKRAMKNTDNINHNNYIPASMRVSARLTLDNYN